MQDYVPLERWRNIRKTLIISVITLIFIIFICAIFFIFLSLKKNTKKDFLEQSMFYVCAAKSKNIKELENMQDNVKEFGGAGKIYQKDGYYYLILNSYLDKESAENVAGNNKTVYENVQVLELCTKKVSNKVIQKFKQSEINMKFLKKLNNDLNEIFVLQMQFLSGEISENDLCSKLLTLKFDNADLIAEIKLSDDGEFKSLILNFASMKEMYFNLFFNSFFDSDKKSSIICEFVVGLSLLKVDFFNNL